MNYQPTELCLLGEKYGADKAPQIAHTYTPYYYEFLKFRKYGTKKVLEFGVGNFNQISKWQATVIGASLKMWRDFFPNAWVYGADWCKESIIQDERLSTYYANLDIEADILKVLEQTGTDLDLIVDDASHHWRQQVLLAATVIPRLTSKDWIYIIEDCKFTNYVRRKLRHIGKMDIPELPNRTMLNPEWVYARHCRDMCIVIRPN